MTAVALFFTAPCAGWLPGRLVIGDTVVPLDVSDVPNNAIEELFDALVSAAAGRSGEVWLHEEPSGHLLTLQALDGDRVRLRVHRCSDYGDRPGRELARIIGLRREILLPLWRGLRQFTSFPLGENDWAAQFYDDFPERVMRLREAIVEPTGDW